MIKHIKWTLVTLLVSWSFTLHAANTQPSYSAVSTFFGEKLTTYSVNQQPNKLAAATNALLTCQQANTNNPTLCELTKLNGVELSTTKKIKAGLPKNNHPLFLWRYTSGTATVYLAGSVHILKPGFYPLAPPYQAAFDVSDHLVLEVDTSAVTPQQMQFKAMQYGVLPQEQGLSTVLDPDLYQSLTGITAEYGLPIAQMERFKPSFITQQLAVLALVANGYDPNSGVEAYFVRQKGDRPVLELETIDFQLELLMNQPITTQVAVLKDTLKQMSDFEPLTAELFTAWLSGDDQLMAKVFTEQAGDSPESKEFTRKLMDERNVGMVEKIQGYLGTQGTYFVLIGAGHYVGPNNIIELLAKKGIKGDRLSSNSQIENN